MENSSRPQAGSKREEQTRVCRVCGEEKSLHSEFYQRRDRTNGRTDPFYRRECKECFKALDRFRRLGITPEQYEQMLIEQKFSCAICESKLESSRYTKFAVDHCHKTGKTRGLLCTQCNTALGLMKDSIVRLQAAVDYLLLTGTAKI